MKKYSCIILVCLCSVLYIFSGCADRVFEDQDSLLPNGKIRLILNYDIPQSAIVETKAIDDDRETRLQNAVILIFEVTNDQQQENSDRLVQIVEGDIQQNQTVSFVVSPYKGKCRIKVLANLDDQALAVVRSYQTLGSSSATTIQNYKELKMAATSLQGNNAAPYLPLCSAEPTVVDGIHSKTDLALTLKRIYARVEVAVDPSVTDFILHEIYLVNGYKSGRFEPYLPGEYPIKNPNDFISVSKISTNKHFAGPVYLFENLDNTASMTTSTTLILKATFQKDGNQMEGYYKINVGYYIPDGSRFEYDINRNTNYKVKISNVNHFGAMDLKEAIESNAENIALEYEVEFDDLENNNDMLYHSSGYAISSSNSEVFIHAASPNTIYSAATLVFQTSIYNNAEQSRRIKVMDNGDIQIINADEIINSSLNTPVDIKIKLAKPDVSGTIELRFGGLRKLIKVKSFKMLRSDKQYNLEISNVLSVERDRYVIDDWFRYGTSLSYDEATNQDQTFVSPTTVYFMAPENTGDTREATPVYLFRKIGGTLKLLATQTYGSPYINDVYFRETGDRNNNEHKDKRANLLLIPTKEAQTYRLTGSRIYDHYGADFKVRSPKAEIVWCDFKFKDPNPFEPHDVIEVEIPSGNIEDVIFRVRKYHMNCGNSGNGNLIWGIKNEYGDWLWSWHAWITDMVEETRYPYQPDIAYTGYQYLSVLASKPEIIRLFQDANVVSQKCLKTYANNVLRVYMDRNIGAKTVALTSSAITQSEGLKHYGLYYQWGRKDPFPINNSFYTLSNPTSNNSIPKSNSKISVSESLNKPLLYITSNGVAGDSQDWCSDPDEIRWNSTKGSLNKGTKTIFDPSPYGWRVNWGNGNDLFTAQDKEWQNFIGSTNNSGGLLIQSQYWIPASGSRYFSTADVAWVNSIGAYWTTSDVINNVSSSYCSYFFNSNSKLGVNNNYYIYRTYGCQVRSVLDN